jgi:ppGpp synthetase/RelA/SpoT-type nucleotidyltranferase
MLQQLGHAILGSPKLMASVHSTKSRLKDPAHLEDKLLRKLREAKQKGKPFTITQKNLLYRINDLAGFRILHLHTEQIVSIDRELRAMLEEYRFPLLEKPKARTWDDESRELFRRVGIQTIKSPRLYTSVHYVVESNSSTRTTCEIQVRTLAEELWGEVDHMMNYPHESSVPSCREQIKVLARVTSSCSRLVDSIFRSAESGIPD